MATDIEANTLSAATVVILDGVESPLRFLANPESGVAPMEVKFSVLTTLARPITGVVLDADGDGVADFSSTALPESILFTYTQPGLYYATILLTDDQGLTYSDTITVNVLSLTELDALLKSRWEGMKTALTNKDTEGAIRFFADSSKEMYRYNFTLMNNLLPQIASDIGQIQFVRMVENGAAYEMNAAQDGQVYSFYVLFVMDVDGIWKIRSF
jgi:PKD repeat protein